MTTGQWWANARHYITFGAGILCTLGVVTATQQADALANLDQIADGVTKIAAAVVALITAFAPIVNGLIAGKNASPQAQVQAVSDMATQPSALSLPAKEAIVVAAAVLPEVEKVKLDPSAPLALTLEAKTPSNVTIV